MVAAAESASRHDLNSLNYPILPKSPSASKREFSELPNSVRARNSHIFDRVPNNWYREPSWPAERLFQQESFAGIIWDGCCGGGTIPEAAKAAGLATFASDLVDRGYGAQRDFLTEPAPIAPPFTVVTNPPHQKQSERQFVERGLELGADKVVILFQTSKMHAAWPWLIPCRLARVYLLTPRPSIPPGEMIERGEKPGGGGYDYSWLIFDRAHKGPPTLGWLHRDISSIDIKGEKQK